MNATLKIAAVAVLALTVGIVIDPLRPPSEFGAADPSPTPSPSPIALPDTGELVAGTTYYLDGSHAWGAGTPRISFTVPAAGWSVRGLPNFGKDLVDDQYDFHEILVTPWNPANLLVDPCGWRTAGQLDPSVGPSVDDLATALVQQAGGTAEAPTDLTGGMYTGKRVELSIPADLDVAACDNAEFMRWTESSFTGGHAYANAHVGYTGGQGEVVYILDADGIRGVMDAIYIPGTSEADLAEVDALVASIRLEPVARPEASPSPSPSPAT